jgi:hypothetical protein
LVTPVLTTLRAAAVTERIRPETHALLSTSSRVSQMLNGAR